MLGEWGQGFVMVGALVGGPWSGCGVLEGVKGVGCRVVGWWGQGCVWVGDLVGGLWGGCGVLDAQQQ